MARNIRLISVFFIILFILFILPEIQAKPHYEYANNNQFIRLYDSREVYCINLTSGLQFGTDLTDSCSGNFFNRNEICVQVLNQRRCYQDLPLNSYTILIDNQSYVNVTFSKTIANSEIRMTYTLLNDSSMIYQSFLIKNNNFISPKFNLSYIITNINIDNSNSEKLILNQSSYLLNNLSATFINFVEDGFDVVGTDKYFHLNIPYIDNHYISVKNKTINFTITDIQIPARTQKSFLFSYFDPVGDCISLVDNNTGCWGNQFTRTTLDGIHIDATVNEVGFRFNWTKQTNDTAYAISFCINNTSGKFNSWVGIQYNNPSTNMPNGTWINANNVSSDWLAGCQNTLLMNPVNFTKNQLYHVVFNDEGSSDPATSGEFKTIKWVNPKITKLPYDFSNHLQMQVEICCPANWKADSDGTVLFSIKYNTTVLDDTGDPPVFNSAQSPEPFGWTYDTLGQGVLSGLNVRGEVFKIPYELNVTRVDVSVKLSDGYLGGLDIPDNFSIVIRDNATQQALTGGKIFVNISNSTYGFYSLLIKNTPQGNLTFTANRTYMFMIFCNACNGIDGEFDVELARESIGHVQVNNATWLGLEGYSQQSSNNGTSWGVGVTNLRSDMLFRFFGHKLGVVSPPVVVTPVTPEEETMSSSITLTFIISALSLVYLANSIDNKNKGSDDVRG